MTIKIITTGGTIDKIYFDAKSTFEVGAPQVAEVLERTNVTLDYQVVPLLRKDSLDLTDADRQLIHDVIANDHQCHQFVITHGTDTMVKTGNKLKQTMVMQGKTVVMTGAMQPARFRQTDAVFNIASAITAAQILPAGVYIAMNGRIFDPTTAQKNVAENRFEVVNL